MPRQRSAGREHWPRNMYRNAGGTYWFRDPETKETLTLGKSEALSIRQAKQLNAVRIRLGLSAKSFANDRSGTDGVEDLDKDGLHSATYIRQSARVVTLLSGVYFLIAAGDIVYVGQSMDCSRRIIEHMRDPEKTFDSYHILECQPSLLLEVESRYIAKLRPSLNIYAPPSGMRDALR
jgi:hypothetical protein